MCGDALLVAPVVQPGGEVEIALPPGAWYDLISRQRFPGQRVLRYKAALDQFPVFGREGHALPMGLAVQHTGEIDPAKPLEQLWVFGRPTRPLQGFLQANIVEAADGTYAIGAVADVKVELFGDAAGITVAQAAGVTGCRRRTTRDHGGRARRHRPGADRACSRSRHRERPFAARLVVVGDRDLLVGARDADRPRAAIRRLRRRVGRARRRRDRNLAPADRGPGDAGTARPANAHSVLAMLQRACDACATGAFAALVTAPVQKSVLMDAGIPFAGHTEFFAQRTHTPHVVMLLVGGAPDAPLRVALVTTHLALKDVPAAITRQSARRDARASSPPSSRAKFALAVAAHRRLRPQPARRRGRAPRPRGDRRHRAGDRRAARRGPRRDRPAARRHGVRARDRAPLRRDRRDVPRPGPARAQGRELRPRHQRDARAAVHPHVRRPRHRARPRGRRDEGARRGSGEPHRRRGPRDRARAARRH